MSTKLRQKATLVTRGGRVNACLAFRIRGRRPMREWRKSPGNRASKNLLKNAEIVSGHDFSRAANTSKSTRALAPESRFSGLS